MKCNCGDSTVFCTIERSICRSTTTGMSRTLSKNRIGSMNKCTVGTCLCHNCNTNYRNVSLTITETSTTLSRPSTPRMFFLLPLFLSPRRYGEVAGPFPPCARFGGSERQISMNSTVEFLHVRLVLRLFSLPPPLLLLLLLLQLEVLGQEEGDGGAVNAVATQRRHHQERRFPRGVPARCGHSAAARQPQTEVPAAPPEVESSVPVGRSAARAPPPPRPWWQASGSVERRLRCAPCRTSGASPLPGLQRSTAARVATTSAVVAACDAEQLPSRAAS